MTNSSLTFRANDWRLTDRFAGFTLIDLHGEWLRGEWFTVTVALLGLRLTYTRWLVPQCPYGLNPCNTPPYHCDLCLPGKEHAP